MTLYVDSSALLAILLGEPTADRMRRLLAQDAAWTTGRHTLIEVRRNITRGLPPAEVAPARFELADYWERMSVVELDEATCALAAEAAERTGARTLDALHLGAAQRAGGSEIAVLTLDRRLGEAARTLGLPVRGLEEGAP